MFKYLKNVIKRKGNSKSKDKNDFKAREFQEALNEYNATESKEQIKPNY